MPREGCAAADAVWHDTCRDRPAGSPGEALNEANRLSRLYHIPFARADGDQDRIGAYHADGCRQIAKASSISDEHCVPVSQDGEEIGKPVLIRFGIAGDRGTGIGGGRPPVGAAVWVSVQKPDRDSLLRQRRGKAGGNRRFPASTLGVGDCEDRHWLVPEEVRQGYTSLHLTSIKFYIKA